MSSLRLSLFFTVPKSHLPMKGMSFRNGMPLSYSDLTVSTIPANTTVWPSSNRTSAVIFLSSGMSMSCGTYTSPCDTSIVCPPIFTFEYSSSTVSMTVPFGLIFGVIFSLMPMSFAV